MRIQRIHAWQLALPLREGSYKLAGEKSITAHDSTIVGVGTETGITGYGEVCPLGPSYLPAYSGGISAGIAELGAQLLGVVGESGFEKTTPVRTILRLLVQLADRFCSQMKKLQTPLHRYTD